MSDLKELVREIIWDRMTDPMMTVLHGEILTALTDSEEFDAFIQTARIAGSHLLPASLKSAVLLGIELERARAAKVRAQKRQAA